MIQFFGLLILFFSSPVHAANPNVLYVGTNVPVFYNSRPEKLIISVIASDADGIQDLIGGVLIDDNGSTYGVLSTTENRGAYTIALGWNEINDVAPIFLPKGGANKTFTVRVFDQAGGFTEAPVNVTLSCSHGEQSACRGSCKFLDYDAKNCGVCGRDVKSYLPAKLPSQRGLSGVCRKGQPLFSYSLYSTEKKDCSEVCREVGLQCGGFERSSNPYDRDEYIFFSACTAKGCFGEYQYGSTVQRTRLESCTEQPPDLISTSSCYCSL